MDQPPYGNDGNQGPQSQWNQPGGGNPYQAGPRYPQQTDEKALISLITGIMSIVLSWMILTGIGLGIAAIITGHSYRKQNPYPSTQRSMATAGLTTGIIGLSLSALAVIGIIIFIIIVAVGATVGNNQPSGYGV